MPWIVETTRPAHGPSKRNPHRKTERIKTICKQYSELYKTIGHDTIDADRIVITYLTNEEYLKMILSCLKNGKMMMD